MPDQADLILEELRTLKEDVKDVTATLNQFKGSMEARVEHLCTAVENLRAGEDALHRRVDKKDERIRDLEQRQHKDELKFTALETKIYTNSRNNKWWIGLGVSVSVVIATAMPFILKAIQS